MRLLALDQSSRISGYAIFEDGKLINYDQFTFTNTDLGKRLERIRNKVYNLIKEYNIDEVILEDIQLENTVGNNVITYKALAEVIGVITELLTELKIKYSLISPSTWRKQLSILGYKRADCKLKAQNYVKMHYGIETSEDICDAICIGASQYNNTKLKADFDWA